MIQVTVRTKLAPYLLLLALLCACSQTTLPTANDSPVAGFLIDPVEKTVQRLEPTQQSLDVLTETEPGQTRPLVPGVDIQLENVKYDFKEFGNRLDISMKIRNIRSDFDITLPFTFEVESENIIRSREPNINQQVLNGNGVLSPGEATSKIWFQVWHKGEPFTYNVVPQAAVRKTQATLFPDGTLERIIRSFLNKPEGVITKSDLLRLKKLTLTSPIRNLEGLQFATNLEELFITSRTDDLSPLSSLTKLKELSIDQGLFGPRLEDISPLAPLKQLEKLSFYDLSATDLSAIGDMPRLRKLKFASSFRINLSSLGSLPQLEALTITSNSVNIVDILGDINALSSRTSLTSLNLSNNDIADLSPLSSLTKLTSLNLSDNDITDLSPLSSLTKLTKLNLYANYEVTDISPLGSLKELVDLNLSKLTLLVVPTLCNIPNSPIPDLDPLRLLPKISRLDLSGLRLTSVAALIANPDLSEGDFVDIRCSNIEDPAEIEVLRARGVTVRDSD